MKKNLLGLYILEGREVIPAKDVYEWAEFFNTHEKRVVKQTQIRIFNRDYCIVSTVFLGIDYSLTGSQAMVFETEVFGGFFNNHQVRYYSYDGAEYGHECMVHRIKSPRAMLLEMMCKLKWELRRLRGKF